MTNPVQATNGQARDGRCRHGERNGVSAWHAACFRDMARRACPMYSILYIIGAIVVIIVVLKVLGLY
jgi:hypothetical protein